MKFENKNNHYFIVKSGFDIISAAILGVLFLPILIVIAILIKITSSGPMIHWSRRIGQKNREFLMPKFRTMKVETPQLATHLFSDSKSYITPVGAILRKTSLDELPQLWSVLTGEMSLVGPRPALYNQHDLIEERTKCGVECLKPGITGWAQINGRDELPIATKVEYDLEYLNNCSLKFDLIILLKTFTKVVFREGVHH